MTIHSLITLSDTTATRLTPNGLHSGMDITIQNISAFDDVFIGGEGVTTSDFGYKLIPGTAISFELPGKSALYAVSETDGSQVAILQTGLEVGD